MASNITLVGLLGNAVSLSGLVRVAVGSSRRALLRNKYEPHRDFESALRYADPS